MESPSGIVKALYHICANRNAHFFKLIHLDITNYPYVLLVKKTRKFPFLIPVNVVSLTMVLKSFLQ